MGLGPRQKQVLPRLGVRDVPSRLDLLLLLAGESIPSSRHVLHDPRHGGGHSRLSCGGQIPGGLSYRAPRQAPVPRGVGCVGPLRGYAEVPGRRGAWARSSLPLVQEVNQEERGRGQAGDGRGREARASESDQRFHSSQITKSS